MSEAAAGALPSLAEALAWRGCELDDVGGRLSGRVEQVYADAKGGAPVWLIVAIDSRRGRLGLRRREPKRVAVPLRECAAMPARVWSAQDRDAMRGAPAVDPTRPLLREHEAAICRHYGIGENDGRHAEVAARAESAVTAEPAA